MAPTATLSPSAESGLSAPHRGAFTIFGVLEQVSIVAFTFALSASAIHVALPRLGPWAHAAPNARSTHRHPIPQAGGLFVIGSALVVLIVLSLGKPGPDDARILWAFVLPAVALCLIGVIDDVRHISPQVRLALYAIACFGAVLGLPPDCLQLGTGDASLDVVLAGLWLVAFVNIVNFMDGVDGMIVAGCAPLLALLTGGVALGAWRLGVDDAPSVLLGALLGFFLFNRPKARIFLGDGGSIPVGFLVGFLLLFHAREVGVVPTLILPLYFLTDAGVTLVRRAMRGEKLWVGHREHFYQRAIDSGQGNGSILARVACTNACLCLASMIGGIGGSAVAIAACGALLLSFWRNGRSRHA